MPINHLLFQSNDITLTESKSEKNFSLTETLFSGKGSPFMDNGYGRLRKMGKFNINKQMVKFVVDNFF